MKFYDYFSRRSSNFDKEELKKIHKENQIKIYGTIEKDLFI